VLIFISVLKYLIMELSARFFLDFYFLYLSTR